MIKLRHQKCCKYPKWLYYSDSVKIVSGLFAKLNSQRQKQSPLTYTYIMRGKLLSNFNRALSFTSLVSITEQTNIFFTLFALFFTKPSSILRKFQNIIVNNLQKYLHVHLDKHEKCLEPNTVTQKNVL